MPLNKPESCANNPQRVEFYTIVTTTIKWYSPFFAALFQIRNPIFIPLIMPHLPSNYRNRITLSRQDLRGIIQAINRDFAPRFFHSKTPRHEKSQFSPRELLAISQEINREYMPSPGNQPGKLVLMTISPRRLHAYWRPDKQPQKAGLSKNEQPAATALRIYAEPSATAEDSTPTAPESNWFEVAVNHDNGHQDIYLPEPNPKSAAVHYRAVLGEIHGDHTFIPLSYSNSTAAYDIGPASAVNQLANTTTPFIIPDFYRAPSDGTIASASGQGKLTSR